MSTVWQSPNKIIARTGQAKGKGDIIVVTKSGGIGSCTVQFRGYNVQIGRTLYMFILMFVVKILFKMDLICSDCRLNSFYAL